MAAPPSRSIDAGIFNVARPSYSATTLQLVKVLMEETKVPKLQQRLFQQSLRSGQPLPAVHRPSQSRSRRPPPPPSARTDRTSGRRSRDTIVQLEDGRPPIFRPTPGRDRDAECQRLAYVMTHGRQQPGQADTDPSGPDRGAADAPPEDRFEELWREVEERRQFLQEMRQLGRGEQYEPIIRGEVARLVQEMEELQRDEGGQEQQQQ